MDDIFGSSRKHKALNNRPVSSQYMHNRRPFSTNKQRSGHSTSKTRFVNQQNFGVNRPFDNQFALQKAH